MTILGIGVVLVFWPPTSMISLKVHLPPKKNTIHWGVPSPLKQGEVQEKSIKASRLRNIIRCPTQIFFKGRKGAVHHLRLPHALVVGWEPWTGRAVCPTAHPGLVVYQGVHSKSDEEIRLKLLSVISSEKWDVFRKLQVSPWWKGEYSGDTPKIRGFSGCVQKVLKTIQLVVGFFKASQNK